MVLDVCLVLLADDVTQVISYSVQPLVVRLLKQNKSQNVSNPNYSAVRTQERQDYDDTLVSQPELSGINHTKSL